MKGKLRQSMTWLHTWSGLVVGWVLYAVFVTGTLAYFRPEISHWMRPELHSARMVQQDLVPMALEELRQRGPNSTRWVINPPSPREPTLRIAWMVQADSDGGSRALRGLQNVLLDPTTGEPLPVRQTHGGDFFSRFHYELQMGAHWGRWAVGICAMIMLVAILSGIIAHRQIFKNVFTFRPGKGQRSWLDGHNVAGVAALPYHMFITYTGLITLMLMYMPWGVQAGYRYDPGAFLVEAFPAPAPSHATGRSGRLTDLQPILAQARERWGSDPVVITIDHPSDAGARVKLQRSPHDRISNQVDMLIFDGISGELVDAMPAESGALKTRNVLYGLHVAQFPQTWLRWLFACSGLLGCVMVASGLVLWTVKRLPDRVRLGRTPLGHRLVEWLNLGTITGLPLGAAAYLCASRLVPADLPGRINLEPRFFFIAWGLCYLAAAVLGPRRGWSVLSGCVALAFLAVPVLSAINAPVHLPGTLFNGPPIYAALELSMLFLAALFAGIAWQSSPSRRDARALAASGGRNQSERP